MLVLGLEVKGTFMFQAKLLEAQARLLLLAVRAARETLRLARLAIQEQTVKRAALRGRRSDASRPEHSRGRGWSGGCRCIECRVMEIVGRSLALRLDRSIMRHYRGGD